MPASLVGVEDRNHRHLNFAGGKSQRVGSGVRQPCRLREQGLSISEPLCLRGLATFL